jgi:hypothetical protein
MDRPRQGRANIARTELIMEKVGFPAAAEATFSMINRARSS